MIAMAMVSNPELLITDEPTTALDVGLKNILLLLKNYNGKIALSVLLIHDPGPVADIADEVIVMYKGRSLEPGVCTSRNISLLIPIKSTTGLRANHQSRKGKNESCIKDFLEEKRRFYIDYHDAVIAKKTGTVRKKIWMFIFCR